MEAELSQNECQSAGDLPLSVSGQLSLQEQRCVRARRAVTGPAPPHGVTGKIEHQDESNAAAGATAQCKQAIGAMPSAVTPSASVAGSLLEQAPDSWLHRLTNTLPAASKKALFGSSRWLAKHVVGAVAWVTLTPQAQQQMTAEEAHARGSIITGLLSSLCKRQCLEVDCSEAASQLIPRQLAPCITHMTAHMGTTSAGHCWAGMTSLLFLRLWVGGRVQLQERFDELCEAAAAGQLPQLRTFLICRRGHNREAELPNLDRLVRSLGPQLVEVYTAWPPLVKDAQLFTQLQHLKFLECTVPAGIIEKLCEHPTLRHVGLEECMLEGYHSHRRCKWETITMQEGGFSDLVGLPPARQIQVVGCIIDSQHMHGPIPQQHLDALPQQACRIICEPYPEGDDTSSFTIEQPCEAMVPLLKCLQGVRTLRLVNLGCLDNLGVLRLFYQALPASVSEIFLDCASDMDSRQVWQGFPRHVTRLQLDGLTATDICSLARTAPLNIQTIVLQTVRTNLYASWKAYGLQAVIPKGLHVEMVLYAPSQAPLQLMPYSYKEEVEREVVAT